MTPIRGEIDDLRYINWSGELKVVSSQPFVAGDGWIQLNDGDIIMEMPERRNLEEMSDCPGNLFDGDQPCCTEKLFGKSRK